MIALDLLDVNPQEENLLKVDLLKVNVDTSDQSLRVIRGILV